MVWFCWVGLVVWFAGLVLLGWFAAWFCCVGLVCWFGVLVLLRGFGVLVCCVYIDFGCTRLLRRLAEAAVRFFLNISNVITRLQQLPPSTGWCDQVAGGT